MTMAGLGTARYHIRKKIDAFAPMVAPRLGFAGRAGRSGMDGLGCPVDCLVICSLLR